MIITDKNIVMLIYDSEIDAFINQEMIQNYGFTNRVLVFHKCNKVLSLFHNFIRMPNLPKTLFANIVFWDLNKRQKNGFYFLEESIKLLEKIIQNVKIVFTTSSNNENDFEHSKMYPHFFGCIAESHTFLKHQEIQQQLST